MKEKNYKNERKRKIERKLKKSKKRTKECVIKMKSGSINR